MYIVYIEGGGCILYILKGGGEDIIVLTRVSPTDKNVFTPFHMLLCLVSAPGTNQRTNEKPRQDNDNGSISCSSSSKQ